VIEPRVPQPEQNDRHGLTCRKSHDLSEVQIECDDDAILTRRLAENLTVRQALEAEVPQMDRVVPFLAQAPGDPHVNALIDEESHAYTL
jgi:hypothetical protein